MKCQYLPQWGALSFIAGALTALLPGCSSTRIQSTRYPAGLTAAPFRNVMVVGMDERPEIRSRFENDVGRLLQTHGHRAGANGVRSLWPLATNHQPLTTDD